MWLARVSWVALIVDQFDDVKAGRAAQDVAGLARFQPGYGIGVERRQAVLGAYAEIAAGQGVGRIGVGGGDLGEILALLQLLLRLDGAAAQARNLVGARLFGQAHDDMGQRIFGVVAAGFCAGEVGIDLGFGNGDATVDFAITQARHGDFLAYLLAELGPGNTVLFERGLEFVDGQLVVFGDATHGGV